MTMSSLTRIGMGVVTTRRLMLMRSEEAASELFRLFSACQMVVYAAFNDHLATAWSTGGS